MLKPAQKRALMSFCEASDQGIHSKLDKNPLLRGFLKFIILRRLGCQHSLLHPRSKHAY